MSVKTLKTVGIWLIGHSDGGTEFEKALKTVWPHIKLQHCIFHVSCQVKRYTTSHPNTAVGIELYALAKDLLHIKTLLEAESWIQNFVLWMAKHNRFLSQMSYDENGNGRPTHERLIKAQRSLLKLVNKGSMFTYLSEPPRRKIGNFARR